MALINKDFRFREKRKRHSFLRWAVFATASVVLGVVIAKTSSNALTPDTLPTFTEVNPSQDEIARLSFELTLPELQGSPDMLSARDRERIAEGYFMVYQRYEAQHRPDAIYALIGARWFDPAVYERHRDDLGRQRLRIMELSPLYGDGVPRLLAATFYPSR
jgi:hypothetical protein